MRLSEGAAKKLSEMGCSTKEFSKHVRRHIKKYGMKPKQAVAAAYSELRKSCGVKGKAQKTPKEMVKHKHKKHRKQLAAGVDWAGVMPPEERSPNTAMLPEEKLISESVDMLKDWGVLGEKKTGRKLRG